MSRNRTIFTVLLAVSALVLAPAALRAATPPSGTVSSTSPTATWTGGPFLVSNPAGCTGVDPGCDQYALTIVPPERGSYVVEITTEPANESDDYDLFVFNDDGDEVGSSATASGRERVSLIDPPAGTYTVEVQAFLVATGSTYQGAATLGPLAGRESNKWTITYHGECCEGNLASSGSMSYVLLPELLTGNDIKRSADGGLTWEKTYPLADLSVPFGIEGDLRAYGDDVVFFGTELTHGVAARSTDRGGTWTVVQIPVAFAANDQAWQYLGPIDYCPLQTVPYALAGWYRIGSVALFSCDGGLTWPIQTPLPGANGSGPAHVVCEATAREGQPAGDTRVADSDFAKMKSGRHGGFGTDGRFYWTQVSDSELFVCRSGNFGATWEGIRHSLADGTPTGQPVTNLAFDQRGTLYVLHANKLYVSFDQGESFALIHTLPQWGNDPSVADGAGQFFVVDNGTIHIGLKEASPDGASRVFYLRGKHVDTAHPGWKAEHVDTVGAVRLDFMQITVDGNGIPTLGYTTPPNFTLGVTTASRRSPL
ncbi:MAG: hypothetical protein ACRD2T_03405 [Thermoanaerobaculia bacterium]